MTELGIIDAKVTDDTEAQDPEKCAHFVARAELLYAVLCSTSVTAFCGYTFVPTRNPDEFPICQKCIDVDNESRRLGKALGI